MQPHEITIKRTVKYFNGIAKKKELSDKQMEQMIKEMFKMLAPLFFEGWVMRMPWEIGELSLESIENYVYSKRWNRCIDFPRMKKENTKQIIRRPMQDIVYYLQWTPGNHKGALVYMFNMTDAFRTLIKTKVRSGKKPFSYSKNYKGRKFLEYDCKY